MAWGSGDDIQMNQTLGTFDTEEGALEAFSASLEEGFEAGPTKAIYRYVGASLAENTMTGAEANEKYGLEGTEVAYSDDDNTSEFAARQAADRYFERKMNEATINNASDKPLGTIASFAGSLTAGFVDPVNIATGVGVASMVKSAGAVQTLGSAMGNMIKNPWIESSVRNGLENIVATAAVDLVAVPLGETVTREQVSTSQRIMNVVGGTIFGTTLGVGMEARGIMRTTRAIAREKGSVHGSKATEVMDEAQEHAIKNHANGKKANPDFIDNKHKIINHTTRAGQEAYVPVELSQANVKELDYFVAKGDHVMHSGDTGYVVSDNANLVSNRVTPLDGSTGEMFHVKLDKNAKIVTPDIFPDIKADLPRKIAAVVKKNGYEGNDAPLINAMDMAIGDAADIGDIPNVIDDLLENYKNMPDSADILNTALDSMGYDGYRLSIPHKDAGNAVVLFKKSDGAVKGRGSISESIPTQAYDPKHPSNKGLHDELVQHNTEEAKRLANVESDIDYDAKAVQRAEDAPDMDDVKSDDFDNLADKLGLDKENLKDSGLSDDALKHAEALKSAESHNTGGKALMKCILDRMKV